MESADRSRQPWRGLRRWATVVALLMPWHCPRAAGTDAADAPSPLTFNAFGTAALTHASTDKADFVANPIEASGAGYTHSWSFSEGSLLGAQLTAAATSQLSAVLQVISEQTYNQNFSPHVEWANIKYQITPDFSLRIGRTAQPTFMVTDSRRVGYSNPWVRPPLEVYALVPVTSNDGLDLSYRLTMGVVSDTLQLTGGRSNSVFGSVGARSVGTVQSRQQILAADSLEAGFLTLRLALGRARITIPTFTPLFAAIDQFGPQGLALTDEYSVNDRAVNFRGVGFDYDPGSWFAMGEWGRLDTNSLLGDRTGWYLSAGYRFGKLTPYGTYGDSNSSSNRNPGVLNAAGLPPMLAASAGVLNAALDGVRQAIPVQDTISLGLRWDFIRNLDLKLQFDHMRLGTGSAGTLRNLQPGFELGSTVNVFTTTIDFVY